MKQFLIGITLWFIPMTVWGIWGGRPIGAMCSTTSDVVGQESSECFTGSVCVYNAAAGEGNCFPDCIYIDKNEFMPIDVWSGMKWGSVGGSDMNLQVPCATSTDYAINAIEYRYRCPFGFYGKPTNAQDGCYPCSGSGVTNIDIYTYGPMGGYFQTSCVLRSGTNDSDSTGRFTVMADCPWVQ